MSLKHEAAAVEVDDQPVRVGRPQGAVEAAPHAVGVDLADLGDLLARLLGGQAQGLGAGRGDVVPLGPHRFGRVRLRDGATGVGEENHG